MSTTKIEWAEASWNPITGCTKISPGCKNCYAERMAKRLAGRAGYPKDEPFRPGTIHTDKMCDPRQWKKPRVVFVCSMGDLFHECVPDRWLDRIWAEFSLCPQHTFLILTKRPDNMGKYFESLSRRAKTWTHYSKLGEPLPNVWLGVTAENQEQLDKRVPILLQIPAAKHFVSIEPMLGRVMVNRIDTPIRGPGSKEPAAPLMWRRIDALTGWVGQVDHKLNAVGHFGGSKIDWVIVGGETGPGWRAMDPQWARDVRDQCKAAGVPFFMKKMAGGGQPPEDLMVREYPA